MIFKSKFSQSKLQWSSCDCQLLFSVFFFHRNTEIGKHMVDVAPILYSRHHKVTKRAEFSKKLHRLT